MLFFSAVLWLMYGVYIYYDMAIVNLNKTSADIATIFLFLIAALMFVGGIIFGKKSKRTYYFVLIVVILNTLLALSNLSDLIFLIFFIIDLVILLTLLPLREEYTSSL
ncbi:MAG: hypothetical protein HZB50_11545 [Chloroflexi bacterium]|nr:hypothetical protein [Chloroflexota bacterium]